MEGWVGLETQEANGLQTLHRVSKALETEGASDHGVGAGQTVQTLVMGRVPVRETFQGEARQEVQIFNGVHQRATSWHLYVLKINIIKIYLIQSKKIWLL